MQDTAKLKVKGLVQGLILGSLLLLGCEHITFWSERKALSTEWPQLAQLAHTALM